MLVEVQGNFGLGTLVSFPFDMVRTRLVAQKTQVYSGTRDAISQIFKSAGPTGFYKGKSCHTIVKFSFLVS